MHRILVFACAALIPALWARTEGAEEENAGEWVSLFDGTSLDGWRGYNGVEVQGIWTVEPGGVLHLASPPEDGSRANLITEGQYGDFELRFEWKVEEGTNSGVIFRVGEGPKQPYLTGPEYQILDNEGFRTRKGEPVGPKEQSASHYAIEAAPADHTRPVGEWNEGRIVAKGNHIEYWLNGEKTAEYELQSPRWKEQVANSKFHKWKDYASLPKGHIVLQDHGHRVWFRHLKIREL